MDLAEQLHNVQTYHAIIQRQYNARAKLVRLLYESRCQYGSHDTARELYETVPTVLERLKKRNHILTDALELEGYDVEDHHLNQPTPATTTPTNRNDELPILSWYKHENEVEIQPLLEDETVETSTTGSNKRQKTSS